MAEIGSWNGHSFTVSPTLIRGFTGLTIKGSSETEDKTSNSQKYVSRKKQQTIRNNADGGTERNDGMRCEERSAEICGRSSMRCKQLFLSERQKADQLQADADRSQHQ